MRCLFCYKSIESGVQEFHPACSRKLFGQQIPPVLPYSETDLEPLAREIIQSQTAIAGVQAKLSLHLGRSNHGGAAKRFTIVGLWGGFILKPPTELYPQLPELEDLTMHLAQTARIITVPHSLIRMASGHLAYITKRVDRTPKGKLAMEDMCQLTDRLTEDKYRGSYEQIAKAILNYSAVPGLDLVNFFELVLFSFLTGNADMHLKNFSLLEHPVLGMTLAPAYDLLNTSLVNPADEEELALTLNGKKKRIKRRDFVEAMNTLSIDDKQQQNIFDKMSQTMPRWMEQIDSSFISPDFKTRYKDLLRDRMERISGSKGAPERTTV